MTCLAVSIAVDLRDSRLSENFSLRNFGGVPVEAAKPAVEARVVHTNGFEVAEEDSMVGCVKAGERCVKTNVGLCDMGAEKERSAVAGLCIGKVSLKAIETSEQREDVRVVGFLTCREAAFIDAIVDCVVYPFVHCVNLGAKMFRVESLAVLVSFAEAWLDEVVKFRVHHPNDFAGFVVDNSLSLAIPKGWHSVPANVVWVSLEIELLEASESVERITIS